jgi:hypothetical protein
VLPLTLQLELLVRHLWLEVKDKLMEFSVTKLSILELFATRAALQSLDFDTSA